MIKRIYDSGTGCCKRFDPKKWDGKLVRLKGKLFLKDRVVSFFHIPLNFGQVMAKDMEKVAKAGALPAEPMMLSDENSLWGSDIYIAVGKEVPDAQMVRLSGSFLFKAFEGGFRQIGSWVKEMQSFVAGKGKQMKKLYFWYTTCPACAKAYGKNYVVLAAQV